MERWQALMDQAAWLMTALPARAQYGKWLWEALKLIGGSAIATILALQISIARHQEQMEVMRRDIEALRAAFTAQTEKRELADGVTRQKLEEIVRAIHQHELSTLSDELLQLRQERANRSMRQP